MCLCGFHEVSTSLSIYTLRFTPHTVGGRRFWDISDRFADGAQGATFQVRFKGGDGRNLVACKYEIVGRWTLDNLESRLRVTSRYIGVYPGDQDDVIMKIREKSFWQKDKDKDVVVYFPLSGRMRDSDPLVPIGMGTTLYLSSTDTHAPSDPGRVRHVQVYMHPTGLHPVGWEEFHISFRKGDRLPVRLFRRF